jgi:uracil-DNA glycosylase
VVLGQDPYHQSKQANGLCFSVNKGINIPPSLLNIFKEIKRDLKIDMPQHGDLSIWAKQGVLLLNSVLTVEKGKANSHKDKGWEILTDYIIKAINDKSQNPVVFLLWGNYAKNKKKLIKNEKHIILETTHPSPFSANMGFLGCGHFSLVNKYLKSFNIKEINWKL